MTEALPDAGRPSVPPAAEPAGAAESAGAPGRGRLPSLTGLRFAAAFLVFGFHLQIAHLFPARSEGDHVLSLLFGHGAIGVSFFFILSGFVLTWSAGPRDPVRRVWRNRAAKIFPNHLVTALAALAAVAAGAGAAAGAAGGPGAASPEVVVPNLLLVQSWSPNPDVYFGLNTVSWSLSCEAFFYLLFPFLLRGLARLDRRALWPAAIVLTAVVWCLPLATAGWSEATAYWFLYVLPATRLAEFCLGMALARIVASGQWFRCPAWAAGLLLVGAYASIGYLPVRLGYVAVTVVPLALLIPALASADLGGRRTLWATRWAVLLGEVSFAFYMVHQLVIRFAVKALHVPAAEAPGWSVPVVIAVQFALLAAALTAAALLWRIVERPLNNRLRSAPARRVPAI
ncbi:acyltransferase family protein [Streptacidiphilus sp. N1-3]|uniref:Acyltransferase family protein n=1 Tax=Streptacidiphilus alkalitolerans TaxID=3342712 RepID=A0ABV6XAE2_9ACTN